MTSATSSRPRAAIILAAGQGTRMKSALPKVLHPVAGMALLGHVIAAVRAAGVARIVVVAAPGGDAVRAYAEGAGCAVAVQDRQLGTGHAARAAAPALEGFDGDVVVAFGDSPLTTAQTFARAFDGAAASGLGLVTFRPKGGGAYGRIVLDAQGRFDRIVEYKDASAEERAIDLCNAGILAADAQKLFGWAARLTSDNAQCEYYLTDVPALAKADGAAPALIEVAEEEALGVNSRGELAAAERIMQDRLRAGFMAAGVGLTAPETVYLSHDTVIEPDVTIEPFVVIAAGVTIRGGARIRSHSHLEGCDIASGAIIGPFARLRPGAKIGQDAHIGNFVEVKNTTIEAGAKANHLTYLGDAHVGAKANIGAGTITCNYDGFTKAKTEIGAGAFIGSDTALVAPVTVGAGAITAAGSVITKDVPADALAIARGQQSEKPGWAKAFRTRKQQEKK
ncbi:MAG: bifunctional UDP-N-acetylglucosamine diphosphorylase/glucosamine-1-phosphate N-acetyltransferase GlmU [Alphaproteobacteria bacterium]|nr:bifunctional UDP-N-acetylglucosamine diphosphorylase/glucosamine-1-phosphate N-acetyltransferase GlmU [Alphaproteobacteria bacterium]